MWLLPSVCRMTVHVVWRLIRNVMKELVRWGLDEQFEVCDRALFLFVSLTGIFGRLICTIVHVYVCIYIFMAVDEWSRVAHTHNTRLCLNSTERWQIYRSKLVFTVYGVCLVFAQLSGAARLTLVMRCYWLWHTIALTRALMCDSATTLGCWTSTVLALAGQVL